MNGFPRHATEARQRVELNILSDTITLHYTLFIGNSITTYIHRFHISIVHCTTVLEKIGYIASKHIIRSRTALGDKHSVIHLHLLR